MPQRLRVFLAALTLLVLPASALGWNGRGHMTVAYIAYNRLSTSPSNNVRKRVDDLLKLNPYYGRWTQGVPAADRGLVAFMQASVWPDDIKQDTDYVGAVECGGLPHRNGFDDKDRHRDWHYLDIPFSLDGTALRQQCSPNALTVISAFRDRLSATSAPGVPDLDEEKAYDLTWLVHLVGDIHQPLHATQRFSAGDTNGDGGGNDYKISGFTPDGANFRVRELHGYWDNVLGVRQGTQSIRALANEATGRYKPQPGETATDNAAVEAWLNESFIIGRYYAHEIDRDKVGSADPAISAPYNFYAQHIARHRVAQAGYRLANLLNQHLK
jgi:hypothetical protein